MPGGLHARLCHAFSSCCFVVLAALNLSLTVAFSQELHFWFCSCISVDLDYHLFDFVAYLLAFLLCCSPFWNFSIASNVVLYERRCCHFLPPNAEIELMRAQLVAKLRQNYQELCRTRECKYVLVCKGKATVFLWSTKTLIVSMFLFIYPKLFGSDSTEAVNNVARLMVTMPAAAWPVWIELTNTK